MEWQQLEYFNVVAQTEHFTKAAEQLSIAQPTLSRSISKLESELGVPLFERKGRQVILNRYGRLFYERTAKVLNEMEEAKRELSDLIHPYRGSISFAFLKSLGASSVPKLVHAFLQEYPNVQFQIFENATNIMLDQLQSGEIDFCMSSVTESRAGIQWEYLWKDELYAYVPDTHSFGSRQVLSISELAHESFIALKKGYGSRTIFDQLFEEAEIVPNITFEGEEFLTVIGFVAAHLGVALLPEIKGVDLRGIKKIKLKEDTASRVIGIAWNKDKYLTPVAKKFQGFLIQYFKDHHTGGEL
ncbi:LysR family transcriptional regulator [Priestia aryabhattai]|uniref:LysR family transcriptional regulator n=1 Tax=Priestia aryabhattai TaxID=412384 RepID=UPI001C8DBE77|nr:LysR family transcriptional regulator [Priestia aryabhattai]MBY0026315.1 LysR family transcriptional regulator [Priestia aryabhattai]